MAGGMKSLAKDTAIYGISSILGRFLNWLLVPMYVRVLDTTGDYGVVTNLYGWTALLLVLLTYGMETGFFRFINKKEEKDPMQVYSTSLISVASTSLLFILAGLAFLTPVSRSLGYADHPEYIGMLIVIVGMDAFSALPFAYLRYRQRPLRFAFIKLLNIFLNIFLNVFFLVICPWIYSRFPDTISWFYHPGYGVGYVFIANVLTSALNLLLMLPELTGFRYRLNFPLLKKMLSYSFPILILGVAGIFNQTADKILFPFLFEDKEYAKEQLGIYGACFKIAVVMVMFIQAFRYAYEPFIFARNKGENNKRSYSEAMKYFIIFALFIFLGVMFYLDILKHLVTPDYYPGLKVVPIVMFGELFFGIYFNLSLWYKLVDKTQWGAYFSLLGCAATVGIILVFGPRYGYMACAWASFACNLLMMLLSYFFGQRYYPIAYDMKSGLTYGLLAAVLYIGGMYAPIDNLLLRMAWRTLLLLVFLFYAVRKDLPLNQMPYIGRYFSKNKENQNREKINK
ncbi:lipopolysaccharide biosynthesis protein [Parabacteroides sp. Marseille-P3160]|uniref:lipopolysaccharide biosynthesis protein n=1 Tax=Parabacteroides sp. Marseille-P3160 TaxID=1917887 RepID=UPI0009BB03B8|nr:lipopolysaccharide biosynthesis protein [Parabacteroides sp. Marseille-P3160]